MRLSLKLLDGEWFGVFFCLNRLKIVLSVLGVMLML